MRASVLRHRLVASFLLASASLALAERASGGEERARVRIRLLDVSSGEVTPAMVCISGVDDGTVRLPPDGRVAKRVSLTREFYRGVRHRTGPGWIGPVRKMSGRGDNDDRSFVYEDRPSIPYWREPVMFQTPAEFSIDLPAGRWRIAVSRGMEYVPVVEEIAVEGPGAIDKELRLERWIDLASEGWYSGDVHVHHPTLEEAHRRFLLEYARAEDLRVVNVLEMGHHKGTDFRQEGFGAKHRSHRDGHWLVSGQEEPRSTFGHIIGLNLQGLVRDVKTYDFYDVAFRGIHAQPGALVGFAHFAWNGCALPRGFPWYVTTGELDFVELLQFGLLNTEGYADYLNLGFRLSAAAGSDVPWGSTIGEVRTYVYTGAELDIDGWFEGLRRGHTFVSNGPALELRVDGKLPGSEITLDAGREVRVTARARGHAKVGLPRELVIAGPDGVVRRVVRESGASELSLDTTVDVRVSQWLVAHTACVGGAVAHTSPVYIVVGGEPTWSVERGPAVIRRQLEAIAGIETEFREGSGERERGILERLERARGVYRRIEEKLDAARARRASQAGRASGAADADSATRTAVDAWWVDSLQQLLVTAPPGAHRIDGELHLARGETEAIQLAVRSRAARRVALGVEGLPADLPVRTRVVGRVPITRGTHRTPPEERVATPPAMLPDPLLPGAEIDLAADTTESFWLDVTVPAGADPGRRRARVIVRSGGEEVVVLSLELVVHSARVPFECSMPLTNWFSVRPREMGFGDAPAGSDAWWEAADILFDSMWAHRQNMFWTPLREPWIRPVLREDGELGFDFSFFDRWVEAFSRPRGGTRKTWIEGQPIAHRRGYDGEVKARIWRIEGGKPASRVLEPGDAAAREGYRVFLTALRDHLAGKGWLGRFRIHITDEPHGHQLKPYETIVGYVREFAPEFRTMEALDVRDDFEFFERHCDVWVPQLGRFDRSLPRMMERLSRGEEVWTYTCLFPNGRYPNRFVDYPLIKTRILKWINFQWGFTGYLHWGFNHWRGDPFRDLEPPHGGSTYLPPGDAWIVYPGEKSLLDSVRHEAMRDGVEDYELLTLLARTDAGRARDLAGRLVTSFTEYERDPVRFRRVRLDLLRALDDRE